MPAGAVDSDTSNRLQHMPEMQDTTWRECLVLVHSFEGFFISLDSFDRSWRTMTSQSEAHLSCRNRLSKVGDCTTVSGFTSRTWTKSGVAPPGSLSNCTTTGHAADESRIRMGSTRVVSCRSSFCGKTISSASIRVRNAPRALCIPRSWKCSCPGSRGQDVRDNVFFRRLLCMALCNGRTAVDGAVIYARSTPGFTRLGRHAFDRFPDESLFVEKYMITEMRGVSRQRSHSSTRAAGLGERLFSRAVSPVPTVHCRRDHRHIQFRDGNRFRFLELSSSTLNIVAYRT